MPFTKRQKELRAKRIGSSEMAAVLGISPWATPYDVWLQKTGKVIDVEDESQWLTAGTRFETGVLGFAEAELGPLIKNQRRVCADLPLAATIDALVVKTGEPVEAKTTGLFGPVKGVWGEEGTDQVPDHYIVQCQVHMMATGAKVCHLPAFIGGRGFVMFTVKDHEDLAKTIADKAKDFWENYVVKDVEPDATASLSLLKRVIRKPKKVVDVEPDLVAEWMSLKAKINDLMKEKKEVQAELIQSLGDAEAGLYKTEDGSAAVTYYESDRKGYTVEPSKTRTLRHRAEGLPEGT